MRVSKSFSFDAAHRLQNHGGKCRNLHGHTYVVVATLEGSDILPTDGSGAGMLVDFDHLNTWWGTINSLYDHSTILDSEDPLFKHLQDFADPSGYMLKLVGFNGPPTAEAMAKALQRALRKFGQGFPNVTGAHVAVYETPRSWAEM